MTTVRLTRDGTPLLTATLAASFASRGRGLLGRPPLAPGQGLLIRPCNSVHTWFMRQTLDLVGLTAGASNEDDLEVTWIAPNTRPWRFRFARGGTKQILELPSGEVDRLGLHVGARLSLST